MNTVRARATTARCSSSKFAPERVSATVLKAPATRIPACIAACVAGCAAFAALWPAAAQAHGFGQRFDLPLPLWLWITGAGGTIVLTFVALALFATQRRLDGWTTGVDLLRTPAAQRIAHRAAQVLRALGAMLFLLALATGFFGNQNAYANLVVTLVWVIWWVGMAFFCALVGDLWEVVDPLRTLYLAASRLLGRRGATLGLRYPTALGAWPAVLLYFGFAWVELVWQGKDLPAMLASAMLGYALLTWAGMALFGVEAWRDHGDAFVAAFRVLGRFAPLQVRSSAPGQPPVLRLRHYAAGLLTREPLSFSGVVFVLLMLSTVTFDGFHQTPLMERIETTAQTTRSVAEALFMLSATGLDETRLITSTLLLAFAVFFVLIYRATVAWIFRLGGEQRSDAPPANTVVLTLVPIAVAYHLSHYFTLLLTTGQFIVPLASDPYGWGWNLFGTRGYEVNLAVVGPALYWYGAVVLIVVGHVQAVVVAHIDSLRRFQDPRAALRSQLPMVALMVAYTSLSLWIMAQPIVG